METVEAKFLWLPLPDALALSSNDPLISSARIRLSELDGKWTVVQPRGTMAGQEYHQLQTPSGEAFHFSMPNVLHIDASNSEDNQSSEYQYADTEMQEQFVFDSFPPSELFPWPKQGSAITPKDEPTRDNRKALFLWLRFNQLSLMKLRGNQNEQITSTGNDLYIHVFLNGSICSSRMILFDDLKNMKSGFHDVFFHGIKIGAWMEKIWIVGNETEASHHKSSEDIVPELGSAARWKAINQKLMESVSSGPNTGSAIHYPSTYISAIADLPVPRQGLSASDATFAVIDVMLVRGSAQNCLTREQESEQEQPMFTAKIARIAKRRLSHSSDSDMSIIEPLGMSEEASNIVVKHTQPPSETEDSILEPSQPVDFDEGMYWEISSGISPVAYPSEFLVYQNDDSDDVGRLSEAKAATKLTSQMDPELNDAGNNSQQSRDEVTQVPYRYGLQNHDESDGEMQISPTHAPVTGHISNLAALRAHQIRPARAIAQFVKTKRRGGGKRRRAIASNTSVATRHSFPACRSPGSGPTNSVEWPSTSSETRRLRQAKSDLSLPRKKRRRFRYRSADFDSEDPVATIPDTLTKEGKIRIVPRNEKPLLPRQEEEESEPHGSVSKLVKPVVHRNLRKKRERQIVKRNPEVGLTERDMYNWIEADYDAREGLKPLLERRDNEDIPLAQSLEGATDEVSIADLSIHSENAWDRFTRERRGNLEKTHDLMRDSIVTVSDLVTRSAPDEEVFEFKSEEVLEGARFIFI